MFRQRQNKAPQKQTPLREVGPKLSPVPKLVWVGQHPRQPLTIYPR